MNLNELNKLKIMEVHVFQDRISIIENKVKDKWTVVYESLKG